MTTTSNRHSGLLTCLCLILICGVFGRETVCNILSVRGSKLTKRCTKNQKLKADRALHNGNGPDLDLLGTPSSDFSLALTLRGGSFSPLPDGDLFNNAPFWISQKVIFGANLGGFFINVIFPYSHYHVEMFGTGAFGAAALAILFGGCHQRDKNLTPRVKYSAVAVTLWSAKLATFLVYRLMSKGGYGPRLTEILANPSTAIGFWLISLVWGVICSLPFTMGTTSSSQGNPWFVSCGTLIYTVGLITETLADYQKWVFKRTHSKLEFCNVGLWSLTQHPNWFGNLLIWTGIFLMNASALIEPARARNSLVNWAWRGRRVALAALSPLYMGYLFYGQATGRITPDALKQRRERYGYGVDPVYTKYVDSTSLVIPNPLKLLASQK